MAGLSVQPVSTPAEADIFARLPALLGGAAAGWTVPLFAETRRIFDPGFNLALSEWRVPRWVAWREGRPVGRIAASLPIAGTAIFGGAARAGADLDGAGREEPGQAGPAAANADAGLGHFGFLALEPDAAVLDALLGTAAGWLTAQGASRLRGPLSFTINHDSGAQVGGFGGLPMPRMPRNPPWLPAMLDASGLRREMDLLACTLDVPAETHRARFAPLLARWPGRDALRIRPLRRARLMQEVMLVRDLYNDAWGGNWGATPVTAAEATTMARLLRPLLLSGAVLFAEWRGEPIGLLTLLPNIEAASARLDGRLLPWGWAAMLRALLASRSARVPMLGIRQAWRGHPVSAMAQGALLSGAIALANRRGWRHLEISWILEENHAMRQAMARLGAPETGRWRLWGTALPWQPQAAVWQGKVGRGQVAPVRVQAGGPVD